MKILCATDFSTAADQASRLALALAKALGAELELFHVVQIPPVTPPEVAATVVESLQNAADVELERRITEFSGRGVQISRQVVVGFVDEMLAARLDQSLPPLLVLGGHGRRGVRRFLGSVAERMLRRAKCPVLVVPDGPASMRNWWPDRRPLRITGAVDLSAGALAMTEFLAGLARATPCDLDLVHLYWPPREHARLGVPWPLNGVESDPAVPLVLQRELNDHLGTALAQLGQGVQPHLRPTLGEEADPLLMEAAEKGADLVALGNNHRDASSLVLARVRAADLPVLCVPVAVDEEAAPRLNLPPVRTVLVTTDFSPFANAAIAQAYRLVRPGGEVVICHVADPGLVDLAPEVRTDLEKMLAPLVPPEALAAGIRTRTAVHSCRNTAEGIVQMLRRTAADLVIMASHGRTGLGRALLGSVTEAVVRRSPKPVVVVPSAEHTAG